MSKYLRKGVFISYSHNDKKWLNELRTLLKPMLPNEAIWDDSQIPVGGSWADEIVSAIASARVAVLLVTPEYLASDFITNNELPRIIERQKKEGLTILWIAVKPSLYNHTFLDGIQAANNPKHPLSTCRKPKRDQELLQIAEKILAAANINAIANVLHTIDIFEPQSNAFIEGRNVLPQEMNHNIVARQDTDNNMIIAGLETITEKDLAKLDIDSQKLILALESSMNVLFDRWLKLEPERSSLNPVERQRAFDESDQVRKEICVKLNQILDYLGFMGKHLDDHYWHIRYICQQAAKTH